MGKRRVKMKYVLSLALLLLPAYAMAAPEVKIEITAEKVVMVEKDGKKVEAREPALEVYPGDILAYILTYKNLGNEAAHDVALRDPIPESTTYVAGSVFGPGTIVGFSIDDGKTFKGASLLSYEINVNGKAIKKKASPEQYTHIQWIVKEVAPGKSGMAGFRVRVN